jgi:hypothetical protein
MLGFGDDIAFLIGELKHFDHNTAPCLSTKPLLMKFDVHLKGVPDRHRFSKSNFVPAKRRDRSMLIEAHLGFQPLHEGQSKQTVRDNSGETHLSGMRLVHMQRMPVAGKLGEGGDVRSGDCVSSRYNFLTDDNVLVEQIPHGRTTTGYLQLAHLQTGNAILA